MTRDIVVSLAAESELETGTEMLGVACQAVAYHAGRAYANRWMRAALAAIKRLPCRMNLTMSVADGTASWNGSVVVFNRDFKEAVDAAVLRLKDVAAEAALFDARFSLTVIQTYQLARNRKAA